MSDLCRSHLKGIRIIINIPPINAYVNIQERFNSLFILCQTFSKNEELKAITSALNKSVCLGEQWEQERGVYTLPILGYSLLGGSRAHIGIVAVWGKTQAYPLPWVTGCFRLPLEGDKISPSHQGQGCVSCQGCPGTELSFLKTEKVHMEKDPCQGQMSMSPSLCWHSPDQHKSSVAPLHKGWLLWIAPVYASVIGNLQDPIKSLNCWKT